MRVLMISDVYFPRVNGVSTSIQTFARGLVASGQETTLMAPNYSSRSGQGQAEPFEVLRMPSRYLPLDPEDRILRPGRIMALLTAGDAGLARRGFDLLHIQTPFVAHYTRLALAHRLGVPVVESYRGLHSGHGDPRGPSPRTRLPHCRRGRRARRRPGVASAQRPSAAPTRKHRGQGLCTGMVCASPGRTDAGPLPGNPVPIQKRALTRYRGRTRCRNTPRVSCPEAETVS